MNLKIIGVSFLVVFMSISLSLAQGINLDKSKGVNGELMEKSSITDLISAKTKLISTYLQSKLNVVNALEKAGEAFGVKDNLLGKLTDISSLKPTDISDNKLDNARKNIEAVFATIKQKIQVAKDLKGDPKRLISESIANLVNAMQKSKGLIPELDNLTNQSKGALLTASLQDKFKVQNTLSSVLTLAKNIPLDLNSYKGILATLVQFAASQNISVPQIAESLIK